ncbi:MAG: hypothetical protein V4709_02735 [Pseudomonadota bacterium]
MTASPLVIQRRLAIQLLHEAQVAAPQSIEGVVTELGGEPGSYLPRERAAGQPVWASVYSNPTAAAVPDRSQLAEQRLTLMISLNTKGVLEMRAWVQQNGAPSERAVSIRD